MDYLNAIGVRVTRFYAIEPKSTPELKEINATQFASLRASEEAAPRWSLHPETATQNYTSLKDIFVKQLRKSWSSTVLIVTRRFTAPS